VQEGQQRFNDANRSLGIATRWREMARTRSEVRPK
jgi:hypothetical protein